MTQVRKWPKSDKKVQRRLSYWLTNNRVKIFCLKSIFYMNFSFIRTPTKYIESGETSNDFIIVFIVIWWSSLSRRRASRLCDIQAQQPTSKHPKLAVSHRIKRPTRQDRAESRYRRSDLDIESPKCPLGWRRYKRALSVRSGPMCPVLDYYARVVAQIIWVV